MRAHACLRCIQELGLSYVNKTYWYLSIASLRGETELERAPGGQTRKQQWKMNCVPKSQNAVQ